MLSAVGSYKYAPSDFEGVIGLKDDLHLFYGALEAYRLETTKKKWRELFEKWENLFFTIKNSVVCGSLSPVEATEINTYLEELIDD